ncbi:DNA-binding MarR family transcriptional regulator [Stackebrandtia albiflava]|uniref:DNA-binding MarR family transcriptional regulator n=1 Tax=Stackebrandtia albiflava TaxID=406432 RepID=A0A562URI3_9ACTN|nr:MarR family transcriptional regulator [Stackebrandtia albiflava]TWJ08224.1 DNA-binding MarR family transcriptional regulator [Stackebrandtia albiflava]
MTTVPVEQRLGLDIKRAEQALMAEKNRVLAAHGLTVAQYAVLLTLRESPGISGAGIARACLVTPQAASAVLKTLELKGLVARSRDEWTRNSSHIELTAEGGHLLAEADRDAAAVEQRILDVLTDAERTTLRGLLERCVSAVHPGGDTRKP